MHETKIRQILALLENFGCTPTDFIVSLLASPADSPYETAKQNLVDNTAHIFDTFSCVPSMSLAIRAWVHEAAKTGYMVQVRALTNLHLGFHFNA
jgi:hypothetical protein